MVDITLISDSTLGDTGYIAEHLTEKLEETGFTTETLHNPLLEDLPASGIWLVISSTHGTGDAPDNLSPFYEALQGQKPGLSAIRFGAIGTGSREYDTFCGAIDELEAELENSGAKQTGEILKINILDYDIPEDPAEEWLGLWVNLLRQVYRLCDLLWITPSGNLDQPVVIQRTTVVRFLNRV